MIGFLVVLFKKSALKLSSGRQIVLATAHMICQSQTILGHCFLPNSTPSESITYTNSTTSESIISMLKMKYEVTNKNFSFSFRVYKMNVFRCNCGSVQMKQ